MAAWLFHRISGIALIFLVGFKIYVDLAADKRVSVGMLDADRLRAVTPVMDRFLLFFIIFHVAYGLRLILIDLGVKWDRLLFWAATIFGIVLFSGSYWYLFVG